jgi:uridine kinase
VIHRSDVVGQDGGVRDKVLRRICDAVPVRPRGFVRVGIDGPDGSGKTVLADELARVLRAVGRTVVRVSADDFHQVRSVRYQLGRTSAEGMWLHSYDLDRLQGEVLSAFASDGDGRYSARAHDLETDEVLEPVWQTAPRGSVLVLDGLFLHRDELRGAWDLSVWLEVPYDVTCARMAVRDGTDADPAHPSVTRYVGAQQIYRRAADPAARADVVVDNADLERPRILRAPPQPEA